MKISAFVAPKGLLKLNYLVILLTRLRLKHFKHELVCSISKLFTSVAIMKLYDEGKLRLDDLVSDLLPAYKLEQKYEESGPITIRALLTHSSGLPREAAYPYFTGPDFPFPSKEQIH